MNGDADETTMPESVSDVDYPEVAGHLVELLDVPQNLADDEVDIDAVRAIHPGRS